MALNAFTLRGNSVSVGIVLANGKLVFFDGEKNNLLAVGLDVLQEFYEVVRVGQDAGGTLILSPVEEKPEDERCLVLVQEYSPGVGAKRWPWFGVDWENAGPIKILAKARRTKGSGSDCWSLIIAPMDWPKNIASQFKNIRDIGGQDIAYLPKEEFNCPRCESGRKRKEEK